jgi:hypothetical protein
LQCIQAWRIQHWLGGNYNFGAEEPGPITLFTAEILWHWVDDNQAERAHWLAKTMPLSLDAAEGGSLTREFLVRYGHNQEVSEMLMVRFVHRGYSGTESAHYRRLREKGTKWLQSESDPVVQSWIERYIASFHERIRIAEIEEERED